MNWSRRFDSPIRRPDGREIATLAQARYFLLTQREDDAVRKAAGALLQAATDGNQLFMMAARISVYRAVYGLEPLPIGNRKDTPQTKHWGKRRLKRDQ